MELRTEAKREVDGGRGESCNRAAECPGWRNGEDQEEKKNLDPASKGFRVSDLI